MTAPGHERGWPMEYDGERWIYSDTKEVVAGNRRLCGHCGLPDTSEGHDGCLGTLPGVKNACCGHGDPRLAYVAYEGGLHVQGVQAIREMQNISAFKDGCALIAEECRNGLLLPERKDDDEVV